MNYLVVIRPEAENDVKEIFSWYEDNRKGLGCDFLLQVEKGVEFIKSNPKAHPEEYKGARKILIKRFPYKIVYLLEKDKIIVLGVIHGMRNPDRMKNRVENA